MGLQIATVADSISKLSVTGLTILDKDQIPSHADERKATLSPLPNFVTDVTMTVDSFGGASAKITVIYTLNYRLFYKRVGAERSKSLYLISGVVDIVANLWSALIAMDRPSGCVDLVPLSVTNMGPVLDYSDVEFWGCDVGVRITEFVN